MKEKLTFPDNQKLEEFSANRHALQEIQKSPTGRNERTLDSNSYIHEK